MLQRPVIAGGGESNMEPSSSQPPNFHSDNNQAPRGRNGHSDSGDLKDSASSRMVADQLMAALATGNLEHLADARQAFLNQGYSGSGQSSGDELRIEDTELHAEEEALRKAELELELRRAEVRATRQKA